MPKLDPHYIYKISSFMVCVDSVGRVVGWKAAATRGKVGKGGCGGGATESTGGGQTGPAEGDGGKAETEVCPGGTTANRARKRKAGKHQGQGKVRNHMFLFQENMI